MNQNLGIDCRVDTGLVLPIINCVTSGKLADLFGRLFHESAMRIMITWNLNLLGKLNELVGQALEWYWLALC